jgi:uncharacterized Rossmann fold enzyme
MDYKTWKPIYETIMREFNFPIESDEKSAGVLNKLLEKKKLFSFSKLSDLLKNKEILVFGAGPSLESFILRHKKKFANSVKLAADGATSALLKYNIYPDIIVTDIDGNVSDQLRANAEGSIMMIHAHGDNIEAIKTYVPRFEGVIMGTTQGNPEPYEHLHNFGGFTDGDRAVHIADHFKAKTISLIGFDFTNELGEYSFAEHKNKDIKLKKLQWCKSLIDSLDKKHIQYL